MWNFLAGLWLGAALSAGDDGPGNDNGPHEPGGCAAGCVVTLICLIVIVLCCMAVASCIDAVG